MNTRARSSQLLTELANAIIERDPTNPKPFYFNQHELQIVEDWLDELLKDCICLKDVIPL